MFNELYSNFLFLCCPIPPSFENINKVIQPNKYILFSFQTTPVVIIFSSSSNLNINHKLNPLLANSLIICFSCFRLPPLLMFSAFWSLVISLTTVVLLNNTNNTYMKIRIFFLVMRCACVMLHTIINTIASNDLLQKLCLAKKVL